MFQLSFLEALFYVTGGFLAGFINTIAGSGSFFTLGLMVLFNIPLDLANGTNRIGLCAQGIVNTWMYKKKGELPTKGSMLYLLPAIFGAILGAGLGVGLSIGLLNAIVAVLMGCVFLLFIFKKNIRLLFSERYNVKRQYFLTAIVFLFIGLYGGFIQVGVGVVMFVGFSITTSLSFTKINGLKNLIILVYLIPTTVIYILEDTVLWDIALLLTFGQVAGAHICSRWSLKARSKSLEKVIEYLIIIMIIVVISKSVYAML